MDFDIAKAFDLATGKINGWLEHLSEMLPNFVVAVIVLIFFYVMARFVRVLAKKVMRRIVDEEAIISLMSTIFYLVTIAIGLIIALNVLKLDQAVTSFLAGAGIIGLALGFAFQDLTANFISGVVIAFRKPIKVGDIIDTNGYNGFVRQIQLRATTIETFQGLHVIIPNRIIFQNPLTNYTLTEERRIDLYIGISYGEDLERVKEITLNAIADSPYLIEPEGREKAMTYEGFGNSSIDFRLMIWMKYTPESPNYLEARDYAIIAIKKAYDKHGITIPFPIRTLDFGIKGGEKLVEQMGSFKDKG